MKTTTTTTALKCLFSALVGAVLGLYGTSYGLFYAFQVLRHGDAVPAEAIIFLVSIPVGVALGGITGLVCGLLWGGYIRAASITCLIPSIVLVGYVTLVVDWSPAPNVNMREHALELLHMDRFGLVLVWTLALLVLGLALRRWSNASARKTGH